MDCIHLTEDRGLLLDLVSTIMNLGTILQTDFLFISTYN
jgi:hypothetical protein